MAKHYDQDKERNEQKRQSNGEVPRDAVIPPKEPEGKHSAPEDDKDDEQ